ECGLESLGAKFRSDVFSRRASAPCEHHPGTSACQGACGGLADARSGSRHDGDLAAEIIHDRVPYFPARCQMIRGARVRPPCRGEWSQSERTCSWSASMWNDLA